MWGIKKGEKLEGIVKVVVEGLWKEIYMVGEDFRGMERRVVEKRGEWLVGRWLGEGLGERGW